MPDPIIATLLHDPSIFYTNFTASMALPGANDTPAPPCP